MFGTVLSYATLRLLGMEAGHATAAAARRWIAAHGGATAIPSWGKFWLAVLGVYEWHGLNPMPPEMWLLPYALPVRARLRKLNCSRKLKRLCPCAGAPGAHVVPLPHGVPAHVLRVRRQGHGPAQRAHGGAQA